MVVTELVDNSLDSWTEMPASKRKKMLSVEISAEGKNARNPFFIIKDNAGGMTAEELANAMTVARSDKADDPRFLGRFGFGLKSACMYIGPEFEIFTRSYKEPNQVHTLIFNHKDFENVKGDKWEIDVKSLSLTEAGKAEVYFPDGHGTEIRIRNEKYVSANKAGIEKRLSRIFGPRLPKPANAPKLSKLLPRYEEMQIKFNNDLVLASGPFYTPFEALSHEERQNRDSADSDRGRQEEPALSPKYLSSIVGIPSKSIKSRKASGIAGIIDRGMAHNNRYGFDLIKNGRVIEMNVLDSDKEKHVGLPARNHYARVVGQLYLDDPEWKTDHQKTEFLRDDSPDTWTALADYVSDKIKKLTKISSDLQEPHRTGARPKSKQEVIVEKTFQNSIPKLTSSVQKAVRTGDLKKVLNTLDTKKEKPVQPKTQKISNTGLLYSKPILDFEYAGKKAPLFKTSARKTGGGVLVTVKVNFDHPFMAKWESGERKAIAEFVAADAIAAFIFNEKGLSSHESFIDIRESILSSMAK